MNPDPYSVNFPAGSEYSIIPDLHIPAKYSVTIDCLQVFAANNVEVVTKTRTEHMSKEDKEHAKANKNPLLSIFGPSETEVENAGSAGEDRPPSEDEYFDAQTPGKTVKIGRSKEEFKKGQKFKVTTG